MTQDNPLEHVGTVTAGLCTSPECKMVHLHVRDRQENLMMTFSLSIEVAEVLRDQIGEAISSRLGVVESY